MWPGPFGAIMMTFTSAGGMICLKWMLKPCAKQRVFPSDRFSLMSFWYKAACFSSFTRIIMISDAFTASAVFITVKPSSFAFTADLEPS